MFLVCLLHTQRGRDVYWSQITEQLTCEIYMFFIFSCGQHLSDCQCPPPPGSPGGHTLINWCFSEAERSFTCSSSTCFIPSPTIRLWLTCSTPACLPAHSYSRARHGRKQMHHEEQRLRSHDAVRPILQPVWASTRRFLYILEFTLNFYYWLFKAQLELAPEYVSDLSRPLNSHPHVKFSMSHVSLSFTLSACQYLWNLLHCTLWCFGTRYNKIVRYCEFQSGVIAFAFWHFYLKKKITNNNNVIVSLHLENMTCELVHHSPHGANNVIFYL